MTSAGSVRESGGKPRTRRRAGTGRRAAAGRHAATSSPASPDRARSGIPVQTAAFARPLASPSVASPSVASVTAPLEPDLFTRSARQYWSGRFGRQIAVLHAGAATAPGDLGAGQLREEGADISVSLIDDGQPVTRSAVAAQARLRRCILGDLRAAALLPRSFDIVHCVRLLDRISHAEVVLDRLVAAIKPGGLLLLQISDRDCAAGFLDRVLPRLPRRLLWRQRQPGRPGPYPAVYEPLTSVRGVQEYARRRGLVIAERQARGGQAGGHHGAPGWHPAVQRLVARLSRGRLTDAHEEVLYVMRKPEDRFARLL